MNPYSKCLRKTKALLPYSAAEFFRNSQQLNQAIRMDRNGAAWSTMAPHGGTDRCAWHPTGRHEAQWSGMEESALWKKEAEPS